VTGQKKIKMRCGVILRSVGEHGAPEAATFTKQFSGRGKRGMCFMEMDCYVIFTYLKSRVGKKKILRLKFSSIQMLLKGQQPEGSYM